MTVESGRFKYTPTKTSHVQQRVYYRTVGSGDFKYPSLQLNGDGGAAEFPSVERRGEGGSYPPTAAPGVTWCKDCAIRILHSVAF